MSDSERVIYLLSNVDDTIFYTSLDVLPDGHLRSFLVASGQTTVRLNLEHRRELKVG